MKITVFGTGYVGLVTGICLAEIGNNVCCVDTDKFKITLLEQGQSPIYEPGIDALLSKNIAAKRISFTTDAQYGVEHGEYIFIAVGTPSAADGSANLEYVDAVAKTIATYLKQPALIINKSTVPVGTGSRVRKILETELAKRGVKIQFDVVSNPEFLKQGDALNDFMHSDRIIIGVDNVHAEEKMRALYKILDARIVSMNLPSAELTKYAANAFLAARISFMNEIALLSERLGADVESVRLGISTDPRVGPHFLHAGCGYGGSCFPKDVKALAKIAEEAGMAGDLFAAIENINARQKTILFEKLHRHFRGDLQGKKIALWGLAFKPHTDDMREAPSLILLERLWQSGVTVQAYDPVAMQRAAAICGARRDLQLCASALEALVDAEALIIVTEWPEFRHANFAAIKTRLKTSLIFDGRNLYPPEQMRELGFTYYCIGRS